MLDIEPTVILWNIINILVLFLLMKKFLFKPVNRILDTRAAAIQAAADQAAADRREAAEAKAGYEEKLAAADDEAGQILRLARQRGQREYEAALKTAQEDAARLVREAESRAEAERTAALRQAQDQLAELALAAAAKASGQRMDAGADRALMEGFLAEAAAGPQPKGAEEWQ